MREFITLCEETPFSQAIKSLTLSEQSQKILELFTERFGKPIGRGRNREVYSNGKNVFKVPVTEYGIYDNYAESRTFKKEQKNRSTSKTINYARCRIIHIGQIPIIVMEAIKTIPYGQKPKWADYTDCGQVGLARDGKVVAYDYGTN